LSRNRDKIISESIESSEAHPLDAARTTSTRSSGGPSIVMGTV